MTPEQELQKESLTEEISQYYRATIEKFLRRLVLDLPDELMVLTTAYLIDRNKLVQEAAEEIIKKRGDILKNTPDPKQLKLF